MSFKNIVCFSTGIILLAASVFAEQVRPNDICLTTEDNSANWYRLYNPEQGVPIPNVEWLARGGLVLNNAYSCGLLIDREYQTLSQPVQYRFVTIPFAVEITAGKLAVERGGL